MKDGSKRYNIKEIKVRNYINNACNSLIVYYHCAEMYIINNIVNKQSYVK